MKSGKVKVKLHKNRILWRINPVEKVKPSKKNYLRTEGKSCLQKYSEI